MFVSHKAFNGRNIVTEFFQRGDERKRRCLAEEEARLGAELTITAYGIPLYPVTSFKYLGRVILAADDDWPAVVNNLQISWRKWVRLTRVLIREGVDAWTSGQIYLAVVQLVMIYGYETWATKPLIGRGLGGLHHRVDRRLTGRQPQRGRYGVWVYNLLEDAMAEAGLQEVATYVSRFQNTLAQFIATRTIMELCLAADKRPG